MSKLYSKSYIEIKGEQNYGSDNWEKDKDHFEWGWS